MLKIKSNTNEFTIIFLRRLETKRMLKRSRSTSVQFSTPSSFFYFLVSALFCFSPLFLFSFGAPFSASASLTFSFLLVCCPLLFSPKYFFSPNVFQPKNTFFSPKRFCFSPKRFSVQPKTFFSVQCHSSLLVFSGLFFFGSALFFLFQRLLFFFSLAPFIQDAIFSLAASHLLYLNKSLFSSNLE